VSAPPLPGFLNSLAGPLIAAGVIIAALIARHLLRRRRARAQPVPVPGRDTKPPA